MFIAIWADQPCARRPPSAHRGRTSNPRQGRALSRPSVRSDLLAALLGGLMAGSRCGSATGWGGIVGWVVNIGGPWLIAAFTIGALEIDPGQLVTGLISASFEESPKRRRSRT